MPKCVRIVRISKSITDTVRPESFPMTIHIKILAALLISLLPAAQADDLGVVGPTYEIAEQDLLEAIQSHLILCCIHNNTIHNPRPRTQARNCLGIGGEVAQSLLDLFNNRIQRIEYAI